MGAFSSDGNSFVGGGYNRTYPSPSAFGGLVSAGWLNTPNVLPGQTNNFLSGYAGAGNTVYNGFGGGIVWSPGNGTATVLGFGAGYNYGGISSQLGGSVNGGFSLNQGYTGINW